MRCLIMTLFLLLMTVPVSAKTLRGGGSDGGGCGQWISAEQIILKDFIRAGLDLERQNFTPGYTLPFGSV